MFSLWYSVLMALLLQAVDGSSWPKGRYALLKPVTGCPKGWQGKGWLLQDTVDGNESNNRSQTLHIDGYVSPSYVIRSFCVKTSTYNQEPNWPRGRYCLYRERDESTLTGMRDGWIKMLDETTSNKDTAIYIDYKAWIHFSLSKYYRHLLLSFLCKTSGNKKIPISLPITKPFYLLPHGSRDCQQVEWMVATTEWIRYHTRNYEGYPQTKYGTVPYHELGDRNNNGITMYYCYYQSCNYTLNDTSGVFQSPGFPDKYPDGQLCSWRIVVPENHTLHVHFTNFSLNGSDTEDVLEWYKYDVNSTFQLTETLHGVREPFVVTGTAELLFKFMSNEEGHSSGFRAEYTVFIPEKTAQPPSSTPGASSPIGTEHPRTFIPSTANTAMPTEHIPEISTTESMSQNRTAFALQSKCQGISTIVVIVTPLVCLVIVVIVIAIVMRRYRLARANPEKSEERMEDKIAANPIYDQGDILLNERGSVTTITTTMETNGRQMYQTLSRDQKATLNDGDGDGDYSNGQMYQTLSRDQKPGIDEKNSGYPKYHELEPIDNRVPDVVYDVLQGPDPNDGPTDDPMYQSMDEEANHESLYQYTMPGTMVKQNQVYDSLA